MTVTPCDDDPVAFEVEEPPTVSHTNHDDVWGALGANSEGAPGMPTIGPCGSAAIWLARTECGLSGRPAISRADARFNAGYNLSPTRT